MGPTIQASHPEREALLGTLGLEPKRLRMVRQIHSRIVRRAGPTLAAGDGLMTDQPEDVLGVTVADCMPICLYDRRRGVLALLHSGWRGTGIVRNALAAMNGIYGSKPEDVVAALGPSIGACCYRVDKDRAGLFSRRFGEASVVRRTDGPYLDLPAANRALLERAGVQEIRNLHRCTVCDHSLGSFRREGPERFTRMLALATLGPRR
jgi:polyphenol oxidase